MVYCPALSYSVLAPPKTKRTVQVDVAGAVTTLADKINVRGTTSPSFNETVKMSDVNDEGHLRCVAYFKIEQNRLN